MGDRCGKAPAVLFERGLACSTDRASWWPLIVESVSKCPHGACGSDDTSLPHSRAVSSVGRGAEVSHFRKVSSRLVAVLARPLHSVGVIDTVSTRRQTLPGRLSGRGAPSAIMLSLLGGP